MRTAAVATLTVVTGLIATAVFCLNWSEVVPAKGIVATRIVEQRSSSGAGIVVDGATLSSGAAVKKVRVKRHGEVATILVNIYPVREWNHNGRFHVLVPTEGVREIRFGTEETPIWREDRGALPFISGDRASLMAEPRAPK